MKTDKKILKSATMVAGALLTTALVATPSYGADILAYNNLGSGSQLRSHLINMNSNQVIPMEANAVKFGELKCGEGKCGEGKCGEGDTKKEAKKSETAETKSAETKSAGAESGEGEKKPAKKKAKKK